MKLTKRAALIVAFMGLVVSCGKNGGSSGTGNGNEATNSPTGPAEEQTPTPAVDGSNLKGAYLAKFATLNGQVVGTIPGSAQIVREEDNISAYVRIFAGSPSIPHFQNIHTGTRCPTLADDKNGDGYIDYPEAQAVVGPVIVPLDWELSSQQAGNTSWPKAFANGSYDYFKETSFSSFWQDLKAEDSAPGDHIAKLKAGEVFELVGKVVLIQGVAAEKNLPSTVAGFSRWTNFQTLPIACGVFTQLEAVPGEDYEDAEIPEEEPESEEPEVDEEEGETDPEI